MALFNIIQAEFFHIGGKNASLEMLLNEYKEQAADDIELSLHGTKTYPLIKTVVRFFDKSGSIIALARKLERVEQQNKEVLEAFISAGYLRRKWLNIKFQYLTNRILALKKQVTSLAAQELLITIQMSGNIAVERADHSFDFVRRSEMYELYKTACMAINAWLFVFEPSSLCSDKNKLIARVM